MVPAVAMFAAEVAGVFALLWFGAKGLPIRAELDTNIIGFWHRSTGWATTLNEWLTTALWGVVVASVFAGTTLDGLKVQAGPLDVLTLLLALLYLLPKVPHTEQIHDFLLHHGIWFTVVFHAIHALPAAADAPPLTGLQWLQSAVLVLHPVKAFAFEEFTYHKRSLARTLIQTSAFYIALVLPFVTKHAEGRDLYVQFVNTPPAFVAGLLGEDLARLHRAVLYPAVYLAASVSSMGWDMVFRVLRSKKVAQMQKQREEEDELAAMNSTVASGKVKRRKK
eukprot:TRINITY_DN12633_c0_g1_i1.p1 TRINITY_DN12633_c0_g1~~TRINITY_DN12633_c0_g1_i1.p1  ORF type:complete len:279 (+),score=118.91 TRINITY_DN12633_c0_g1_i1:69-905(+)